MNLKIENLTEDFAKQICNWKYDGQYSVYNYPKWEIIARQNWAITIEAKRKSEFCASTDEEGNLCGYIRFINNHGYVLVGLGLKPSLCGQRFGKSFMELLKNECKRRYQNKKIILEVRSFNERAIKCYKTAGFKAIDIYNKYTALGSCEFVKMEFTY